MRDLLNHVPEGFKAWLDALSLTALLGTLASVLPTISSLLTFIWMAIRVYETDTVQRLVKGRDTNDD